MFPAGKTLPGIPGCSNPGGHGYCRGARARLALSGRFFSKAFRSVSRGFACAAQARPRRIRPRWGSSSVQSWLSGTILTGVSTIFPSPRRSRRRVLPAEHAGTESRRRRSILGFYVDKSNSHVIVSSVAHSGSRHRSARGKIPGAASPRSTQVEPPIAGHVAFFRFAVAGAFRKCSHPKRRSCSH